MRWLKRFIEDCRDLWTLITKGQPKNMDPILPWRMMAELAKFNPEPVDWDKWESDRFKAHPLACWFDPERYADTPYDWPKKTEAYFPDPGYVPLQGIYMANCNALSHYQQSMAQNEYDGYLNQLANFAGLR